MATRPLLLALVAVVLSSIVGAASARAQSPPADPHGWLSTGTVEVPTASFEFRNGYPTPASAEKLLELRTLSRAVEIFQDNFAALSMYRFRQGLRDFGARDANQVVIWQSLLDAQTLLLTGNTETVYASTFLDLKRDGPTVVEVPPQIVGLADDMWMRYLCDLGITGPDKGKGGKYLFIPPGYKGALTPGYLSLDSTTNGVWLVLGALDDKPEAAATRLKQLRIYPMAKAQEPPKASFLEASGKAIDTIPPDTAQGFEDLSKLLQEEPADVITSRERFFLASIGIEKGKPFAPDDKLRAILDQAARLAGAICRANTFASPDPDAIVYPGKRWRWSFIGGSYRFDSQGYVNLDRLSAFAYAATGITPAMASKGIGKGSQSIWTPMDSSGAFLDGARSYRLRIPPKVPVKDFWSIVVYDSGSRSLLQNGQKFPGISSYTNPLLNDDGSVDIYFGPEAPAGKEKNWIRTVPGKGWFTILRLYGPLTAFFERKWVLGDIAELE
jgi:hypothetical protein